MQEASHLHKNVSIFRASHSARDDERGRLAAFGGAPPALPPFGALLPFARATRKGEGEGRKGESRAEHGKNSKGWGRWRRGLTLELKAGKGEKGEGEAMECAVKVLPEVPPDRRRQVHSTERRKEERGNLKGGEEGDFDAVLSFRIWSPFCSRTNGIEERTFLERKSLLLSTQSPVPCHKEQDSRGAILPPSSPSPSFVVVPHIALLLRSHLSTAFPPYTPERGRAGIGRCRRHRRPGAELVCMRLEKVNQSRPIVATRPTTIAEGSSTRPFLPSLSKDREEVVNQQASLRFGMYSKLYARPHFRSHLRIMAGREWIVQYLKESRVHTRPVRQEPHSLFGPSRSS